MILSIVNSVAFGARNDERSLYVIGELDSQRYLGANQLTIKLTPGNVDDRVQVSTITKHITGLLFGDKGYVR